MRRFFKKCIGGAAIHAIAAASLFVGGSAVCQADIYQWTYAADGHTIIQSTALCPGGAGVSAAPGADLSSRDLTKAALWNKDLTGTNFSAAILSNAQLTNANLTGADLSGADLSHADLWAANLTSADLTSAIVNWTNFTVDGLTQNQLYSTASYQSGNMVGIGLYDINMPGWNLAGKDLSYASVGGGHSHLEGADLTGANLSHAASFAPFAQNVILKNANLTGADLAGSNLGGADLTGANLTGASISQGCVGGSNLTAAQLYSTADYQAKDLCQISFCTSNLANWNFADQNLMRANLASTTLTGTDLSRADLRGATVPPLTDAITHNTVLSDGTIDNLSLGPGEDLIVRNFTTDPVLAPTPIGIHAAGKVSFDHRATLQLDFGQDLIFSPAWNSTISFDPSTSVKLDGTLELTLTDPQDWGPSMLGKSFQLFNWTGVSHSGAFSVVADNSQWDLSHLYTTGVVTLIAVPEPSTLALLIVAALGLAIHLGRCARMRSPRLFGMVAVAAMTVFLVAARAQADGFDWRNVGGLNFTTPPKDQGSAGDCWDFSVVGPLEAKYKMTRNDASYSPDCSEMQLDWDCAWTGAGAFDYVCTHGVVSEAECPFNAAKSRLGGTGPGLGDPWPLAPGWQNRVWISTGTIINTPQNTLSMKACIKMYGSCMMPVDCANDLYPSVSDLENDYHTALPSSSCDHDISVIGYQDDAKVPTGGYWIVKNSWGTGAGTNGYYYVPYGALETKGSGTPDGVPVQFIPGPVYYTGYMANATWRGGAGVWTRGGTNWTNDASSGATYAWQNMETGATFAGIGGNVALSGPVIAHGIAINSAGYSFSAGSLTVTAGGITANQSVSIDSPVYVGAPQTWTVAGGSSLTINGPLHTIISDLTVTGGGSATIAGAIDGGGVLNIVGGAKPGGLIYAGSGELTLSGANNFAGDVTHNGSGVLNIAPAGGANVTFSGALNGSGPIVITTTGVCSIGGSTSAFTGPITQTGGTLSFIPAASVLNLFNGVIRGNCNVAQSGLGATVLYPNSTSGTNTYAGATTISAGALIADIGTGIPSSSFLKLDGGVWQPVAGYTSFTRTLGASGNTFEWAAGGGGFAAGDNGDLSINIGGDGRTLAWGTTAGVNIVGTLILGSQFGNHMTDFQNPIDLGGDTRTVEADLNPDYNMASQFSVLDGVISGSGGLRTTGTGRLDLNARNTYSGDTTISGGVLHANVGQGIPATSFLRLDGGVLQSDAATTFTRTLGTSGGNSFQWTANGGGLSAGPGGLIVNVGGNATPTTLVWGTAVGSQIVGPLMLNSPMSGGTLTFQNGIDLNGGARTITANGAMGKDAYLTGVISDSAGGGSLVKNGAGALHLAGSIANTYTGVTAVNDGTLYLENTAGYAVPGDLAINGQPDSSRIYPGAYVVVNGNNQISPSANVSFNADSTNNGDYAPLATAGTSMSRLILQGHAVTLASISDPLGMGIIENSDQAIPSSYNVGGGTLTVDNSTDCTFNGTICDTTNRNGSLSLVKNGGGRLTVGNYAASGPIAINGGTLDVAAGAIASAISGSGSFAKTVFGDLTLSGGAGNTYTGATTFGQGTLYLAKASGYAVSGKNIIENTSNCYLVIEGANQINPAATLTFNYFRNYWSHLELWGNAVTLAGVSDTTTYGVLEDTQGDTGKGNGTLTINTTGDFSFNGEIRDTCGGDGTLSLVKTGSGTQVFTGPNANNVPNSYTGSTTISGGALQANDNAGLSAASFLVLDGGVLQGNGPTTFTRPLGSSGHTLKWTANGGGFSAANGTMTVNIGGDKRTLTWDAGPSVAGTLKFGSPTATDVTDFQNGLNLGGAVRTIQVDDNPNSASDRAVISGAISGTGGIHKTGPGRLDLTGANSYSALGTTVSGGILNVPSAAALGSGYGTKPLNIASGATLQFGANLGFTSSTGVLSNNGTLQAAAGASLTLSGGAMAQGSGAFNCPVNLADGGVFAPGGAETIGSCSTQSALWGSGKYLLDIDDALGAAGNSWDLWTVSGTLSAPSNSVFTIAPTSLRSNGQLGAIADFDNRSSYSWLIATASAVSDFNANEFAIDTSGFANSLDGGSFSVSNVGNNLYLKFEPASVPEPGTLALLAAASFVACAAWKRKRI